MLRFVRSIVPLVVCRYSVAGRFWNWRSSPSAISGMFFAASGRPGRLRLFAIDRLLWVLLYGLWPRGYDTAMGTAPYKCVLT